MRTQSNQCCYNCTQITSVQENYPGEYIKVSTFNSNIPSEPLPQRLPPPHLIDAPPPSSLEGSSELKERALNVYVEFKLRNITAEFPTVSTYTTHC